jgi:uncharacterized protein (DUF486 family)
LTASVKLFGLFASNYIDWASAAVRKSASLQPRVREYWLAVPANRWGSAVYSAAQLKTIQEVVTLIVFAGFSALYLKQPLGWNHGLGFGFIALGAYFIFHEWS